MPERVLIAGFGSMGRRHLQIARQLLPRADIRIWRQAETGPVPQKANGCFYRVEQVCVFQPQIAAVATPAPFHLAAAAALIPVGCDLLVEKPLSHNSSGVGELLALARDHGVILQVGYNLRFFPSLQKFRGLLGQGEIGRILSVRSEVGQFLPDWRPQSDYRKTVSAQAELGGGVLLELSHEIDYLRWIFGEVQWVSAWLGRVGDLDLDVEDVAHLTLGLSLPGQTQEVPVSLTLDFHRNPPTRYCEVTGTLGTLRWDGLSGRIMAALGARKPWEEVWPASNEKEESYLREWSHFLDCVEKRRPPRVGGIDGRRVLEVIEAARTSSTQEGRRIPVRTEN